MPSQHIRISGRIGHYNIFFFSTYRILLHKGPGELDVQKNGCTQLNHLGIVRHASKIISMAVAGVAIVWK